jgi:hypothetical protein
MQWRIKEIMELKQMDIFNNVYESQVKALFVSSMQMFSLKIVWQFMKTIIKVCPEFGHVILVVTNGNASFLAALH